MDRLTIWCNALFPDEVNEFLRKSVGEHRLIFNEERSSNLGASGPSSTMAEADVLFGQPAPDQLAELDHARWVQITSAGFSRYDRPELWSRLRERGIQFTNSSDVFDEPCAQHLLAFMLGFARALPQSMLKQLDREWSHDDMRPLTRNLKGDRVLIIGFGAIGHRLVELLDPFRLDIVAVRRTVSGDEPITTYPSDELPRLIREADHIVNILPASPQTERLISRAMLESVKPESVFYNVGRGTTVDQPALIDALESGRMAGAYLDVTDPEPLPPDHPLWRTPNCYITAHTAGGHREEFPNLVNHFLENLKRFEAGEPLRNRIF